MKLDVAQWRHMAYLSYICPVSSELVCEEGRRVTMPSIPITGIISLRFDGALIFKMNSITLNEDSLYIYFIVVELRLPPLFFFKPRTSDLKLRITHSASRDDRHCDARIVQSPAYRLWTRFWQALSCIVATHPSRHYTDVIMSLMASQITSLAIVYSPVCSGTDQRKHQSSASLAFVRGIHWDRWIPRTKGQ